MLTIFTKLKLWGAAFFAFFIAICSARHYQKKSKRLEQKEKTNSAVRDNQSEQLQSIKDNQSKHQQAINDSVKDGSYIDYFDPK